jgi:hypothetical protein
MDLLFGTIEGILTSFGTVVGSIILVILAAIIIVAMAALGWLVLSFAISTVYALCWYWPRFLFYKLILKKEPPEDIALVCMTRIDKKLEKWNNSLNDKRQ